MTTDRRPDVEKAFFDHAPPTWSDRRGAGEVHDWVARMAETAGVDADAEILGRALAAAVKDDEVTVPEPNVADLYLATAALQGRKREVTAFENLCAPVVAGVGKRLEGAGMSADEFRQTVRERLLVGVGERPPKLVAYRGAGSLLGWVRVVVGRLAVDLHRAAQRRPDVREELPSVAAPDVPPEVVLAIERHGANVRGTLVRLLAELDPADRRLLRMHSLEGKSFERIAADLGLHRTSASRRWTAIRNRLADGLHRALAEQLGGTEDDAASLAGALRSHVELSVGRLLASKADGGSDSS